MQLACLSPVGNAYVVAARLRERHVAQDQSGLILAVLALDERGGLAENLSKVFAVQRHHDLRGIGQSGKLDFEVEPRPSQNISPINGIDSLGGGGRSREERRNKSRRSEDCAHVMTSNSFG
jgi:hypothetical protein